MEKMRSNLIKNDKTKNIKVDLNAKLIMKTLISL